MSRHKSLSPQSDDSVLYDSAFPDSRGRKSDAARMRELRKKAPTVGLGVASGYPLLSSHMLFPSAPSKRRRVTSPDRPITLNDRIDAVKLSLEQNNLTLADVVRKTCAYDYGAERAKEEPGFQLSSSEAEDTERVRCWAKEIACQELLREAKEMEKQHLLHTGKSFSTVDSLEEWSPLTVHKHLQVHMPYFVSLLESFIKDGKHSLENKLEDVPMAISVVGSILWIKRSQKANYFARGFTQYLYTSGVHAATIGVLNRCGIAVSYGTLLESLETLNRSCIHRFRKVAAHCRSLFMWDNVNFGSSVAEQRVKNSGSFESGTASTLVELHPPPGCEPEAIDEALDLDKYLHSIQNAPDLNLADVMVTPEDEKRLRDEFAFQTVNVLVEHGGEQFKRYKKRKFTSSDIIVGAYPLPTLHLEQASANGNATVTEELRRITEIDKSELFKRRLCLATGDLLTVLRILSLRDVRTLYMRTPVHIQDRYESLSYMVPFCGLFHTRIAAVTAIFNTHFGKPNTRPKDAPISLWRHNELLKRKNIPIRQSLKYRTAQDLTFHSLYARLLDIVQITSGCGSLRQFGEQLSQVPEEQAWDRLKDTVLAAVTRFTTPQVAGTDDVLRNSILFIRDALLFRCFVASIKCGNMAIIELILKVWAVAFRGAGRSQYASELLRFRHNLCHAWPKPLCELILSNMLVNMTGKKDGWKETDLLQEHINYWIKVVYKARGPNASWAWLENISSCVTTLRRLADEMNTSFGPANSNYHTTPSIQADLDVLLKQLVEEHIHTLDSTRRFSNQSLRVKDVLVLGFQSLAGPNSPIVKFNRTRFGARGSHSLTDTRTTDDVEASDDIQALDAEIEDDDLFDVVIDDDDDVEAGAPFDIA